MSYANLQALPSKYTGNTTGAVVIGGTMGDRSATVIIEPRSLMREALASLMEIHSYHIVGSVGSTADIECGAFGDVRAELVILGTMSSHLVAEATSSIRRVWPGVKVVMLVEKASSVELQTLLASGLDACLPLSASPRTLVNILHLVVCERLRVLMVSGSDLPVDDEDGFQQERRPRIASFIPPPDRVYGRRDVVAKSLLDGAVRGRISDLSNREGQILKALVGGQSNKLIARQYAVTEATVKVHLRAILRKIRVANRTQAAIWALQNGYCPDEDEMQDLQAAPAVNGHTNSRHPLRTPQPALRRPQT